MVETADFFHQLCYSQALPRMIVTKYKSLRLATLSTIIGLSLVIIFAGRFLIVQDDSLLADVIVVIGGDHKPQRMQQVRNLFQEGIAPTIIISAGTVVWEGDETVPEAEVMRRQANALGLPEHALLIENQSKSTRENVQFTKQLLEAEKVTSIVLVTSAYHSRRARRIFREILGSDFNISIQPAQPVNNPFHWMFYPDEAAVVRYEYRNWVSYWINQLIN